MNQESTRHRKQKHRCSCTCVHPKVLSETLGSFPKHSTSSCPLRSDSRTQIQPLTRSPTAACPTYHSLLPSPHPILSLLTCLLRSLPTLQALTAASFFSNHLASGVLSLPQALHGFLPFLAPLYPVPWDAHVPNLALKLLLVPPA